MPDAPREDLVVLESASAKEALAELGGVADVTQVLAPRLVLIRAYPKVLKQVARIKGVVGVYHDTSPDLPDLEPNERVFISAWEARRRPKTRPGDQLSWDSPGFNAPDAPTDGDEESSGGSKR
jgi:hypothetical protein